MREESNVGRKEINTDNLDVTGLEFDDATHTYRLDGSGIIGSPQISQKDTAIGSSAFGHCAAQGFI